MLPSILSTSVLRSPTSDLRPLGLLLRNGRPLSAEDEPLRWASPEEVVRLAQEAGMSTAEIVRIVSGCLPYSQALEVAREYSPLLGISTTEFLELRRNE